MELFSESKLILKLKLILGTAVGTKIDVKNRIEEMGFKNPFLEL